MWRLSKCGLCEVGAKQLSWPLFLQAWSEHALLGASFTNIFLLLCVLDILVFLSSPGHPLNIDARQLCISLLPE